MKESVAAGGVAGDHGGQRDVAGGDGEDHRERVGGFDVFEGGAGTVEGAHQGAGGAVSGGCGGVPVSRSKLDGFVELGVEDSGWFGGLEKGHCPPALVAVDGHDHLAGRCGNSDRVREDEAAAADLSEWDALAEDKECERDFGGIAVGRIGVEHGCMAFTSWSCTRGISDSRMTISAARPRAAGGMATPWKTMIR